MIPNRNSIQILLFFLALLPAFLGVGCASFHTPEASERHYPDPRYNQVKESGPPPYDYDDIYHEQD